MSLSVTSTAINFDNIHRAVQQVTVTGGLPPYSASSSNTNVATVAQATSPNLWSDSDTLTSSTLSGFTKASGGPGGANDAEYTGTGALAGANESLSKVISVTPGQTYTSSFFIDPSQVTNNAGSQPNIGTEFSGATQNADGSWSNVDGKSSATAYTLTNGVPFTASADIAKGGTVKTAVIIGNLTNGYGLFIDTFGGIYIQKFVGGTGTTISSTSSIANDTAYHTLRITVIPGATNTIAGTVRDSLGVVHYFTASDSSLTLTSGTWPATLYSGGSAGKVANYAVNLQIDGGFRTADGIATILHQYLATNTTTAGRYATSAWTCPTNLAPNSDTLSGYTRSTNVFVGTGGPGGANDFEYTGTGSASGLEYGFILANVTAGKTYDLSWWVDPSQITSGQFILKIDKADGLGTWQSLTSSSRTAGRFATPSWTCPSDGSVTQVRIAVVISSTTVSSGQKFKFSQPMFEPQPASSGYYISSQNPQVQVFAQLLSSAIVTSGQKFKISQPMLALSTYDPQTYIAQTAVWNITPRNGGAATITYTDSTP